MTELLQRATESGFRSLSAFVRHELKIPEPPERRGRKPGFGRLKRMRQAILFPEGSPAAEATSSPAAEATSSPAAEATSLPAADASTKVA